MEKQRLYDLVAAKLGDCCGPAVSIIAILDVLAPYLHTHNHLEDMKDSVCIVDQALYNGKLKPEREGWARALCVLDRKELEVHLKGLG